MHIKDVGQAKVYQVGFENGVQGEYFAPSGLPLSVGQVIEFAMEPSKFQGKPPHVKPLSTNCQVQANFMSPGEVQEARNKQGRTASEEAMISAVAICKSALEGRGLTHEKAKEYIEEMHHFFMGFRPNPYHDN